MLESTGMLNLPDDENSPLSEDKRIALNEIFELNQERIRKDAEQDASYMKPDEKKKIIRLNKFVRDFHEVLMSIDLRALFHFYQQVVKKKEETID